jgi:hypothetical protein
MRRETLFGDETMVGQLEVWLLTQGKEPSVHKKPNAVFDIGGKIFEINCVSSSGIDDKVMLLGHREFEGKVEICLGDRCPYAGEETTFSILNLYLFNSTC